MELLRRITKRKLFKDTVALQIETFASMAIVLITSVVLTRALGDNSYGSYTLIFAIFNLLSFSRLLGPSVAVVSQIAEANASDNPGRITDAAAYYLKMSLLSAGLVAVVGISLGPDIFRLVYDKTTDPTAIRLIFLSAGFNVILGLVLTIFQGLRMMRHYAFLSIGYYLMRLALIALFLAFGWGVAGAIAAHVLAVAVASIGAAYMLHIAKMDGNGNVPRLGEIISRLFSVPWREYLGLSITASADKQVFTLFSVIPALLLGRYALSDSPAGFLKLGLSITAALWGCFLALANNMLPYMSELKGGRNIQLLRSRFTRISTYCGILSIAIAAVFAVVARPIIVFVYGRSFLPVVFVVYALLVQYVLRSFGVAVQSYYVVSGRIRFALICKVALLIISLPFAVLIIKRHLALGAAIYYSALVSVMMLVYLTDIYIGIRRSKTEKT